jgi:hypothetical protein
MLLGTIGKAAPFMAVGDGAELFVTGNIGLRSDDNIFLINQAESDTILEVTPGAELTFGKNAQLKGSLAANCAFTNYFDHDELNTTLAGVDFLASYDDSKLKLRLSSGYHELNQNTADVRPTGLTPRLTRRDVFTASVGGEVEVSQLTSVGTGVDFDHENYKRSGYGDSDDLSVPVNFYYKWTPKVDLSLGYRYRSYQTTIGQDSTDHFFNIGARGDFTPKLTGTFAVGYTTRDLKGTNPTTGRRDESRSQLGLDASFSYELSAKTNLQLGVSNDFGTSPQGQQQRNFTINTALRSKFSAEWEGNVGVSYRAIGYGTRTDDYYEGNVGATYVWNANVRLIGAYTYRSYSSDLAGSDFRNNVFSIAANFRY